MRKIAPALLCSLFGLLFLGSPVSAIDNLRTVSLDISGYDWDEETEKLYVVDVDSNATEWRHELKISGKIRAEIFDPETGQIVSSSTVQGGSLSNIARIELPFQFTDNTLRLEAVDSSGNVRLLDLLDVSLLPDFAEIVATELDDPGASVVASSTMTTMLDNGDSSNRIDILLLGDGYTQAEMDSWKIDADTALSGFLDEPPYNSYRDYFNAHRIDTVSNESGVSHPESGINRDTAFGSYYNCDGIQRLVCTDYALAYGVVNALSAPGQADIIIVIVNDDEYGGSGGEISVASTHSLATDLVLHETAHSFGLLADEYDDPLPSMSNDCANTTSTIEPNVSQLVTIDEIKWKHWIDTVITIPTPVTTDSVIPGFYAGSKYCNELYRPTPNSKMRNLNRAFDAINEEALVLRIYETINAIESTSPLSDSVNVSGGSPVSFSVETLQPATHDLQVDWFADEQWLASGSNFSSSLLSSNTSNLRVEVSDPTSKVRKDTNKRLVATRTWQIINSVNLGEAPVFSENTLHLPFVRIAGDQSLYQIEMQVTSLDPPMLSIASAVELDALLQPDQPATFTNDLVLIIERLNVAGVDYRIELRYQPEVPGVVFVPIIAEPL